jgi:chromosome segregation ATPase
LQYQQHPQQTYADQANPSNTYNQYTQYGQQHQYPQQQPGQQQQQQQQQQQPLQQQQRQGWQKQPLSSPKPLANATSNVVSSQPQPLPDKSIGVAAAQQQNSTVAPSISSMGATGQQPDEHQRLVSELRKADKQIDELNDYIDTLLDKIKAGDDERAALLVKANATAIQKGEADIEVLDELSEKIDVLQAELVVKNEELESLHAVKEALEREVGAVKTKLEETSSALQILKGNFTHLQQETKKNKKRSQDQEKELEDCYREMGLLETDLKNLAGSNLKRLTRPSFFSRLFDGWSNPFQLFGGSEGSSTSAVKSTRYTRRAKGRLAAAQSSLAMNRTISTLRENLTALANSLSSKEAVIVDLTAQLAEKMEEAEKR